MTKREIIYRLIRKELEITQSNRKKHRFDKSDYEDKLEFLEWAWNETQDFTSREMMIAIERNKGGTLEKVGNKFGVTRERIRQVEARVLDKIMSKYI